MIKLVLLICLMIIQVGENSTIGKLQQKYEQINNLTAEFAQESANTNSIIGTFYFSKKNNYRIDLPNNIIISNGSTIWNQDIKRKKVIISNVEDDPLAFSFTEYIYDYPAKCNVSEEQMGNNTIITLTQSSSELNFKVARLWVDNSYLINKIEVEDFGGNIFSLLFSNISINNKISSSKFEFENTENLKVIDLR